MWSEVRASLRQAEEATVREISDYVRSDDPKEDGIVKLFEKREEWIKELEGFDSNSGAKLHHLQRHRELLKEHKAEFKQFKEQHQFKLDQASLMKSVKQDAREYRQSEQANMLDERNNLDSSLNMADSLLAQAYATRDEFSSQRQLLTNVNRRIAQAAGKIPGINTLISKINTRRKRDALIMALLITMCICGVFYFH